MSTAIALRGLNNSEVVTLVTEAKGYRFSDPRAIVGAPSFAMAAAGQSATVTMRINSEIEKVIQVIGTKLVAITNANGNPLTSSELRDVTFEFSRISDGGSLLTTDEPNGSPASPFASTTELYAWAALNLSTLLSGRSPAWVGNVEYVWNGPLATNWEPRGPRIKIDRYLRGATFGDSTAVTVSGVCDIEPVYEPLPAGAAKDMSRSTMTHTLTQHFPHLTIANGGVAGETTQQFVDRGKSAFSTVRKALQDIAKKKPDFVIFHGASVNDWLGMTAATPQATINAVVARHIACVKYFTQRGIHVFDSGCFGYSVPGANLTAIQSIIIQTNATFKAASATVDKWHFIDMSGITHDGTGAFIPACTSDNTHLSQVGGYAAGLAEFEVFKQVFDVRDTPVFGGLEVLYDSQPDYSKAVNGTPTNHAFGNNSGLSITSKIADASSVRIVVNVTAYETAKLQVYIENMRTAWIAAASAQDDLALLINAKIYDSTGVQITGTAINNRVWFKSNDNVKDLFFGISGLRATFDGRQIIQFSPPLAPADLGTQTTAYLEYSFPANGVFTVILSPFAVCRYAAINPLT